MPAPSAEPAAPPVDEAIATVEQQFGLLIETARASLRAHALKVHPQLQPVGYRVAALLVRRGPLHAAEVAELLSTDKSLVSRTVKQLEELGMLVRQPDPADRRASYLVATAEAVRRFDELHAADRAALYERMRGWAPDEVRQLARLLEKLNTTFAD